MYKTIAQDFQILIILFMQKDPTKSLNQYQKLIFSKIEETHVDRRFTYDWKQCEMSLIPLIQYDPNILELCTQLQIKCQENQIPAFYSYFVSHGALQLRTYPQDQTDFLKGQINQIKNNNSSFSIINSLILHRQQLLQTCQAEPSQKNLIQLRSLSVKIVNEIGKWIHKVNPDDHPKEHIIFVFKGVNYLYKMLTDFRIPDKLGANYQEPPNPLLLPLQMQQIGIEQHEVESALQLLAHEKSLQLKDILEGRSYICKISYPQVQSKKKQKIVQAEQPQIKSIKKKNLSLKNLIKQNEIQIFRNILEEHKFKSRSKVSPTSAKISHSKVYHNKQYVSSIPNISNSKITQLKIDVAKHKTNLLSKNIQLKASHEKNNHQKQQQQKPGGSQQLISLPSIKPQPKRSQTSKNKLQKMKEDQRIVQQKLNKLLNKKKQLNQPHNKKISDKNFIYNPQSSYEQRKVYPKLVQTTQSKILMIKKIKEAAQNEKKQKQQQINKLKAQRQALEQQLLLHEKQLQQLAEQALKTKKIQSEENENQESDTNYKQKFEEEKTVILQQTRQIQQKIGQHEEMFRKMTEERKLLQKMKEKSQETQMIEEMKKRNNELETLIEQKEKQRIQNNRLEQEEKNKIMMLEKRIQQLQKKQNQLIHSIEQAKKSNQLKYQIAKQNKRKQRQAYEQQQLKILYQYEQKNNHLYQLFEKLKSRNQLIKTDNSKLSNQIHKQILPLQYSKTTTMIVEPPFNNKEIEQEVPQTVQQQKIHRLQRIEKQLKKYLSQKQKSKSPQIPTQSQKIA